ncbi:MAG: hypothetical protein IJ511_07880 [Bacteroides sp.]|nr:hypothetical protein [Bacteroides sp.]
MKSITYTIYYLSVLLAVFFPQLKTSACTTPCYQVSDYYTFRGYAGMAEKEEDEVEANCQAWKELLGCDIPSKDIREVVYTSTYQELERCFRWMDEYGTILGAESNAFLRRLQIGRNREVMEFLLLAKKCEELRLVRNSRWYYPTSGDNVQSCLEDIAEKALAYQGTLLRERYLLQAVRALFSLHRYAECLNLWEEQADRLSEGIIKRMLQGYVAGCYYRMGEQDKGNRLNAMLSIPPRYKENGERMSWMEQMECMYRHAPESSYFVPQIQQKIHELESETSFCRGWGDRTQVPWDMSYIWKEYSPLYTLCTQAAFNPKVKNRPFFCYTAAYLADKLGRSAEARQWIARAEQTVTDNYLKESVRVLRIYIDARTMPYTSVYEQRLYSQLQELGGLIRRDLDSNVKARTKSNGTFLLKYGYSFYYWNDMLRKILIGEVAPRYLKQGNGVRALQAVNMADNLLLQLTGAMQAERQGGCYTNTYDYSNSLSALMDTIDTRHLAAYVQRLEQPQTEIDRFFARNGYADRHYFVEYLGTRLLSGGAYAEATRYLKSVPANFQNRLNTANYLLRDPFCEKAVDHYRGIHLFRENNEAKLSFARQMMQLEQSIKSATDPNRKAREMIKYAVGLYNSHHLCWALTRYRDSWYDTCDSRFIARQEQVKARYRQLVRKALTLFTDEECKARAYWQMGYYEKVIKEYPNTRTARFMRMKCDKWRDYFNY